MPDRSCLDSCPLVSLTSALLADFWEKQTGSVIRRCCVVGCGKSEPSNVIYGGHVWLANGGRFKDNAGRFPPHCFIAPVCSEHNNASRYNYPNTLTLKAGSKVLRISAHLCYDYRASDEEVSSY